VRRRAQPAALPQVSQVGNDDDERLRTGEQDSQWTEVLDHSADRAAVVQQGLQTTGVDRRESSEHHFQLVLGDDHLQI
jgi:hypothetical protein